MNWRAAFFDLGGPATMTETATWRAVLFDLDGTLADTVPLILASYRHTMRTHRRQELPDQLWLEHVGRPLRDSLLEFTEDPAEAEAMESTYTDFQRKVHDAIVSPFEGAREVVQAVRGMGAAVGLVTSKRREMTLRTLACCGLDRGFDVLVTADDVERGKPDPEPVHRALEHLGVTERDRVLFVGDSPYDIAAGRAAGVRTAAATWGPFARTRLESEGPDWVIDHLEQVTRLRP